MEILVGSSSDGINAPRYLCFAGGVEGVKTLSTLGGLPAAFLELFIIAALVRVVFFHRRFDRFSESNYGTVTEAAEEDGE